VTRIIYRDGRTETAAVLSTPRPGLPTIRGGPNTVFPTLRLIDRGEIAVGVAAVLGAVVGVVVGLLVAWVVND
jgi:hypothetical protein